MLNGVSVNPILALQTIVDPHAVVSDKRRPQLHKLIATVLQPLNSIEGLPSVHSLILLVRTETEG